MYFDMPGSAIVLTIFASLIVLILSRFKKLKGKQIIAVVIGIILMILYFCSIYRNIPVFGAAPLYNFETMAQNGISQWIYLTDIFNTLFNEPSEDIIVYFMNSYVYSMVLFITISFVYTLGFKKHRKIYYASIFAFCHAGIIFLFPLAINLCYGGLIYKVDILRGCLIPFFYIIGFGLGKIYLKMLHIYLHLSVDKENQKGAHHENTT